MPVKNCCKIIRFSDTGFTPVYQTRMVESVAFIQNFTDKDVEGFTDYAKDVVRSQVARNLKLINLDFEYWGIHAFLDPLSESDERFFLNHLKKIPPRHELIVDASILVHSLDEPYLTKPAPLVEFYRSKRVGVYIPSSSLIHQRID